MKKSIYFKIWKFPKLSETFIVNQVVLAVQLGFEVKILVTDFEKNERKYFSELFSKYDLDELIVIQDYKVPKPRIRRFIKAGFLLLNNLKLLPHIVRFYKEQKKPNLVHLYEILFFNKFRHVENWHVQFGTNKGPLDILKKINFLKGKLIVSFHGHDLFFPINGIIKKDRYYDDLFTYGDLFVSNTPFLEELLKNLGADPDKIRTIPVGVDTEFFRPGPGVKSKEGIRLISVGRLEVFKGHKYGIECVNKLFKKNINFHYTIVGDGSQFSALEKQIKENGLQKNITLTGIKNQKEILSLLQENDIFLMTSVEDENYGVETQGLVTAEAQACGLPVIGFDSGGVKYTIEEGETGFVVPQRDIHEMTEKLEILINNQEVRKEMGKKAVLFVKEKFSMEKLSLMWDKIYRY